MKISNYGLIIFILTLSIFSSCSKDPVASFEFDKNNVKAPVTVNFTNTSTNANEYLWNFGDGVTSTEENPSHQYVKGGDFDISLKAYGEDGTNTAVSTITILPTMTGHWNMTFVIFDMPYTGKLNLVEYENQTFDGEFSFSFDPTYIPISNTSKIEGQSVTIDILLYGTKISFQGTVNDSYDQMNGDFFFNGNPSGKWSATKN